ncbi:hypothetical protein [uncultured Rhodospira sp.]|nr:hypothetical protein [uncultured Rhodospira sp.]
MVESDPNVHILDEYRRTQDKVRSRHMNAGRKSPNHGGMVAEEVA